MGGENIFDIARDKNGTSGNGSSTRGVPPTSEAREYTARVQSQTVEPNGDIRVLFAPLIIKRSPLQRALGVG
jgi:hypothetical protein